LSLLIDIFIDKISAERQRLEQHSKLNGESPTEITYMSGPSSGSPRQQQRMLQQQNLQQSKSFINLLFK
jgi:hypothetical protein